MIEQGKQLIAQLQEENAQLKEENEDKDEDRRLKQYEIDVKAMLESAKLAATAPDMSAMAMQVAQILAQNIMGQAAAAPDVTEEPEEQPGLNFGEPAEVEDGMREEETGQMMPEMPESIEPAETSLDGLLIDQPEQPMM